MTFDPAILYGGARAIGRVGIREQGFLDGTRGCWYDNYLIL